MIGCPEKAAEQILRLVLVASFLRTRSGWHIPITMMASCCNQAFTFTKIGIGLVFTQTPKVPSSPIPQLLSTWHSTGGCPRSLETVRTTDPSLACSGTLHSIACALQHPSIPKVNVYSSEKPERQ